MENNIVLGVDIGGTGIKGALVDVEKGVMITERFRLETPQPSTPENVAKTFKKVVQHFKWKGKIGVGFPAVIKNGVSSTASNIHKKWIDFNVENLLEKASDCQVVVLNDADAAGMAEVSFGEGKGMKGTVILITIGTGLGSAIFLDGNLLTNTEFGHIYLKGQNKVAEKYASNSARKEEDLSWQDWGNRLEDYLGHLQFIFNPDLFILGGGASKKFAKFEDAIRIKTPVKTAKLLNEAGIIGAAVRAHQLLEVE